MITVCKYYECEVMVSKLPICILSISRPGQREAYGGGGYSGII